MRSEKSVLVVKIIIVVYDNNTKKCKNISTRVGSMGAVNGRGWGGRIPPTLNFLLGAKQHLVLGDEEVDKITLQTKIHPTITPYQYNKSDANVRIKIGTEKKNGSSQLKKTTKKY